MREVERKDDGVAPVRLKLFSGAFPQDDPGEENCDHGDEVAEEEVASPGTVARVAAPGALDGFTAAVSLLRDPGGWA